MPSPRTTFFADFRQFFVRGLGIVLPSVLTLALVWWAYGFLQNNVAGPINAAVREGVILAAPRLLPPERLPEWYQVREAQVQEVRVERERKGAPRMADEEIRARVRAQNFAEWWGQHWYLGAIGFIIALVLVYLAGLMVGNFLGKRVFTRLERLITSFPVIKQVYPSVKQVVEFLLGGGDTAMPSGRVVLVEFPRPGMWMIGLMTGEAISEVNRRVGGDCVTVFVPTSPTPFTGFAVAVRRDQVVELEMTFDEALRYVVSGGVLIPEALRPRAIDGPRGPDRAKPGLARAEGAGAQGRG